MSPKTLVTSLLLAVMVVAPLSAAERTLTTRFVGWEQYFKLDWQAGERAQKQVVWGHLLNDFGMPAARIQLLVEGLDSSGGIVGQKVAWFGSMLTPGMRAYFEVPVPWKAPTYRVSVFAFDWVQSDNGSFQ